MCPTYPFSNGYAAPPKPPSNTSRKAPYRGASRIWRESTSSSRPTLHSHGRPPFSHPGHCPRSGDQSFSISSRRTPLSAASLSYSPRSEWLPYDGLTGALILAPIGSVTDASRRSRALVALELHRQSRVAAPYWNDNTFCLGGRAQCIPEATILQRGHRIRHLNRRRWSVGSNRIKQLVVDSEAWRQEGRCKLFWSPWTPMTTSIVSAHIRILPTLAAGSWRGSAGRTPPSLEMKLSSLPPSSSCTKRKTDTESH